MKSDTVNQGVVGSSPTSGAIFHKALRASPSARSVQYSRLRPILAALLLLVCAIAHAEDPVQTDPQGGAPCVLVDYTLHAYDGPIEAPSACLSLFMDRGDWIVIETVEFGDGIFRADFEPWPHAL